ncbi:MAG: hypothetical protein VKP57_04290 [Candidatus Sericytochromatia bacterium]|nr:hypothetical protein [Candidatus Sericytochromatia bacterium]
MLQWSVNLNPARLCPDLDVGTQERALERLLPKVRELGASMVRTDLLWRQLQPEPGPFRPEAVAFYRHLLARLREEGLGVWAVLYNPPDWVMERAGRDRAAFLDAWARYLELLAGLDAGAVAVWQVWNEPNNWLAAAKGDAALFATRRVTLGGREVDLPTEVRWPLLEGMHRIARAALGGEARLAVNILADIGDLVPLDLPDWATWDGFLEAYMARCGDWVDVIGLDHYPDTWVPGLGAEVWRPLERLRDMIADPRSACWGKALCVAETGYASCGPVRMPWGGSMFADPHDESGMARWYARALPRLAELAGPVSLPNQDLHVVNLYELVDPPRPIAHEGLVAIENHFGLLAADATPKPAWEVCRGIMMGETVADVPRAPGGTGPLRWYVEASRASRALQRFVRPVARGLGRTLTPRLDRHDRWLAGLGAAWLLWRRWRG